MHILRFNYRTCPVEAGEWHTGCKRLYDLLPIGAIGRLKRQRRELFEAVNNVTLTKALEELSQMKKQRKDVDKSLRKKRASELEIRVDLLQHSRATCKDPGSKTSRNSHV